MSGKLTPRRFAAVVGALVVLLAVPLGPVAFSDHASVSVGAVPHSTELVAMVDSGTEPLTEITYDVFAADGDGSAPVATNKAEHIFGTVPFHLPDGRYKIRATAPGFLEGWYTSTAGAGEFSISELITYQDSRTFATADVIVVDSLAPANSSWTHAGWTVLHSAASSISGAVASSSGGEAGSLLSGIGVELHDAAAAPETSLVGEALRTDANGYYTFAGVAPGTYKVRFVKESPEGGITERWWPETSHRVEAEVITLTGGNHFNLAYAVFPPSVPVDAARVLTLSGQPALGATLTAAPDFVEAGPFGEPCLQRYTWFLGADLVEGAYGPTFVVPLDAGGKSVSARLDIAGIGCTYTALASNSIGPVDPGLTAVGNDVVAAPVDNTGQAPATLEFGQVTTAGNTTVTRLGSEAAPPAGSFSSLTDPPLYYDIETSAVFDAALGVEVCITFDTAGMTQAQAAGQHLYHYVDGAWEDITVSSSTGRVCGVTHSFSPFAVGQPHWPFTGFLQPVDTGAVLNAMTAGASVPLKFGVGGNRGLDILAGGAPSSSAIACPGGTAPDDIEQTVAAGTSLLSYNAASDSYTFVWKTEKAWAGSCRQLELRLNDGTVHTALFHFRK